MEHLGIYVDEAQPPQGKCTKKVIGVTDKPSTETRTSKKVKRIRSCRRVKLKGRALRRAKARGKRRTKRVCRTHRVVRRTTRRVTKLPVNPEDGVPNRPWRFHPDPLCGLKGEPDCELPEKTPPKEVKTDTVTIANFAYSPGNRTAGSGDGG